LSGAVARSPPHAVRATSASIPIRQAPVRFMARVVNACAKGNAENRRRPIPHNGVTRPSLAIARIRPLGDLGASVCNAEQRPTTVQAPVSRPARRARASHWPDSVRLAGGRGRKVAS
jgi:hypothetical protein